MSAMRASLLLSALLVVLQPKGSLAKGGPPPSNIPITTYFSNLDANGLPADIGSDGLGAYSDGAAGVTSFLTTNGYNGIVWGDWQFDSYGSATRGVNHSLDPDDTVQPGDPHYTVTANPPFWGTQSLKSHIEVKCTLLHNNMLTMTAGSSSTCPLMNRFNTAGNIDYGLSLGYSFTDFPETTDARVVCNTADAGGCNDWFIDPIGPGPAVGRLTTAGKKPNSPPLNDGDFYMRFHVHLTRP